MRPAVVSDTIPADLAAPAVGLKEQSGEEQVETGRELVDVLGARELVGDLMEEREAVGVDRRGSGGGIVPQVGRALGLTHHVADVRRLAGVRRRAVAPSPRSRHPARQHPAAPTDRARV